MTFKICKISFRICNYYQNLQKLFQNLQNFWFKGFEAILMRLNGLFLYL